MRRRDLDAGGESTVRGLRALTAAEIVEAIAAAAERWNDPDFPARLRSMHTIVERTGYSEPVVAYALDKLFSSITRNALRATVVAELGSLEALDGFVARDRGPDNARRPDVFFRGADEVTIISSETTIGVALAPLVFATCAKSHVLVKDRNDRLVATFAETLAEERPQFAESITVERWDGHDDPRALERLATSDVVVAFGGPQGLAAIRAKMRPDARFVPFGHRTSVGYVARESLDGFESSYACAIGAARDALLYDGEGCLSAHALFAERGGAISFRSFAEIVGAALESVAVEFPTEREPSFATLVARDAARFRASQGRGAVAAGIAGSHLLLVDPPLDEPPPLGRRTLALYPVDGPADVLAFLRQHSLPLEGFAASATPRSDVTELAVASGAVRIARLGELQAPSLEAGHGGAGRILPFVRAITRDR